MTRGRAHQPERIRREVLPLLATLVLGVLPFLLEITSSRTQPEAPAGVSAIVLAAWLDEPEPLQYKTVTITATVTDQLDRAVTGATVTATAHYRTTQTVHTAVTDDRGQAVIRYRISRATPGYQVRVTLIAARSGHVDTAELAFTPRARQP